jgi:tetratricopeptide (TPR) repeat protein
VTALLFLGRLDEAETVASAAIRLPRDDPDAFTLGHIAALLLTLNHLGKPDLEMALQLLEQASTSSPSARAVALHTAGVLLDADDLALAIRYNQEAVELAAASGALLIEGFALDALAEFESQPADAARRFVDVMAHYLRVGNRTHLRSFGRSIIESLVRCGAYEAAAVVEGATRGAIVFNRPASDVTNPVDAAIDRAREQLGAAYDSTARRGAHMTDDELVHYLRDVVEDL